MYLYEKKDDSVDIYTLVPNMDKICEYRKEHMETIPEEERVFKAVCRNNFALNNGKLFELNGFTNDRVSSIPITKLNKDSGWLTANYHHLLSYDRIGYEIKREQELIDGYCMGQIKGIGLVLVTDKKARDYLRYLLMTSYYYVRHDQDSMMSNIISIPSELFSLEWCMLGGNFDALDDLEFSKIIKLFDFSLEPIDTYSYEDVIKYRNYGLIDEKSETIISRIDDYSLRSQKTLTRIRKYR